MPKEHAHFNHAGKRDLMRERLAHQAAKLMAEDGITDHAYAKRKAAKQLGASDSRHLPSNEEIDAALRSFRQLFQRETHPETLRRLRENALTSMRMLAQFSPYLTGSVLSGTAGEQSDINLILFSDDEKAVLLFLLKNNLAFKDGECKIHFGGRDETVPSYTLTGESGVQTHLVLLPENARFDGSHKQETHADITGVEALLGLQSQPTVGNL